MNRLIDYLLTLLSQFAGGPGPPENNLVRFGLAALLWALLLAFAVGRQRQQDRPRERLLVAGFALALFRELFMFAQQSLRILTQTEHDALCTVVAPLEHTLTLVALVLIAGSFIRYLLDDAEVARRYLAVGMGTAGLLGALTFLWWPTQLAVNPNLHFNTTWAAWALHLLAAVLMVAAVAVLARPSGWVRNVVVVALSFFALSELLVVLNLATGRAYSAIICPIGNSLYLAAIPLFAYVYFREQAVEKHQAEAALQAYRDHLEELVAERTAELREAQSRLERAAALEERQRLAADMHDGLAQTLGYLRLVAGQTQRALNDGDIGRARREVNRVERGLDNATDEVRRSITSLRTEARPRQSLDEALRETVSAAEEAAEHGIRFESCDCRPVFPPPETLEQVRHVVHEALINAVRHSGAAHIRVAARQAGDAHIVTVEDDGRGFDPVAAEVNSYDHFGLSIMRARATRVGGTLAIDSFPGEGTCVTLSWPVARAHRKEAQPAAPGENVGGEGGQQDPRPVG